MKTLMKIHIYILIAALLLIALTVTKPLKAQTAPPGVSFILVTFDQPPSNVMVEKAPLRYNKKFALSFHTDDGMADVYSSGFTYFSGINFGGTNYQGLFYTDGCGNPLTFKISSALFSFSSYNGLDMHDPANGFTNVTWSQLATMVENGSSIYNHGISEDASSGTAFMNYSIKRNESYIRRKLYDVLPGGVKTRILVNPNGNQAYTQAAFDNGYHTTFRIGGGVIGDNGVNVSDFTAWNQNYEMNRVSAEAADMSALASFMANAEGNWWLPTWGHGIVENYGEAKFQSDFGNIAATYGAQGLDNIWMSTEEEIIDYLRIRELTQVTSGLAGNTLLIQLAGQIPTDQRFYPLSLLLEATGANITNISINGGTNNSFNGVGTSNALINLEWNGLQLEDPIVLANNFVTIAEQTQAQYDCSIAMDYVLMLPAGAAQQGFKDRLCAIPNVIYEEGFCEVCDFDLGADITICLGECVTLEAPFAEGNTYLWSNDSTTQSITVCPEITTEYWVNLTTVGGCEASDNITITVLEAAVFDLGPDQDVCQGDSISFELPFSADYIYRWIADGVTLPETSNIYGFVVQDSLQLKAEIDNPNGCVSRDSVQINALIKPVFDFEDFIETCQNDTIIIEGPAGDGFIYDWYLDGVLLADDAQQLSLLVSDTAMLLLQVSAPSGCMAEDSVWLYPLDTPVIDFPIDIQICENDTLVLQGPQGNNYGYAWFADDELIGESTYELTVIVHDTVTITLHVVAPSGCIAVDSVLVFALDSPGIVVTPALTNLCFGEDVSLQLTAQNAEGFFWWNGSTQQNIDFLPTTADTTYHLWAEAYNGFGCTSRDTAIVNVYSHPEIALEIASGALAICASEPIRLNVSSINHILPQKVVWNKTDTMYFGNETVLSKTFNLQQSGWIKAEIFSAQGCKDTDSLYFSVYENPEITVSTDVDACYGETILLEATGGISCEWYDQNGFVSDSYIIEVQPEQSGFYRAIVSNEAPLFCSTMDSVEVIIRESPEVLVSTSANDICAGVEVILSATGADTYRWNNEETGSEIRVRPSDTLAYEVVGTNLYGCSDTALITIYVFPSTDLSFSGLLPVYCQSDEPSVLSGLPEGGYFNGPGMVAGVFNPELAGDGVHRIIYHFSNEYECSDSIVQTTRVFGGLTNIELGNDTVICPNETLVLDAGDGFSQYFWNTGATDQQLIIQGADYQAGTTREFSVVGVLDGCTASGNIMLTILDNCFIGIEESANENLVRIAPNPGTGDFRLMMADDVRVEYIELYDLRGRQVTSALRLGVCDGNPCSFVIDQSLKGYFILKVFTNKAVVTKALIIR
ncbi:MAG: hypothetical protein RBR87_07495 [Bacteroidales bacterium]|jgi:hypothetical protein|nr:hypothetical protein [Bacteroidales bacterium]